MKVLSERRLARIESAVVSGRIIPYLAFVTIAITLLSALAVRLFARSDFKSFGQAVWWAAQTVTTVGYGDVIPDTAVGKVVAVFVMVFGISTISLITAVVTSAVLTRAQSLRAEPEESRHHGEVLERIERRLAEIEKRLV